MSAPDRIVVMRSPGETRSALLSGDDLIEVVHRRDGELAPGTALMGRVVGHAPGFAFIAIGDTQPGVLKVKAPLVEGSTLAVQVVVPARAGKGAELVRASHEGPAPEPAALWWGSYRDSIEDVRVSPAAALRRLRAVLPDAPLASGGTDPFAADGIDAAIEAALEPAVLLPGGARLMIECTAAATCIDIDAGPLRAADANLAAIPAIARALRLRNLAGHILIDVIPGARGDARGGARDFAARLRDAVAADTASDVQIAGVTPLGMVELTRRRVGLSLAETLADPVANTAYASLRRAVRTAHDHRAAAVRISAAPIVIARLQAELAPALAEAAVLASCKIELENKPSWSADRAEIVPA